MFLFWSYRNGLAGNVLLTRRQIKYQVQYFIKFTTLDYSIIILYIQINNGLVIHDADIALAFS